MIKKMKRILGVLFLIGCPCLAQTAPATNPSPPAVSVALLTFQSNLKDPEQSGQMLADILSTRLSAAGDLTVVERQDIEKILAEQKLTLAGLVSPDQAAKVGKLLGARLLVTGRVTASGKSIYVICKTISTETSQVKGFFLTLPGNTAFDSLVEKTGSKLSETLETNAKILIPADQRAPDDITVLKKLLTGREIPKIAVVIPEQHMGPRIIDPAVETEFKTLLTKSGIEPVILSDSTVREVCGNIKNYSRLGQVLSGTRYLIFGEAFSENGGVVQGLTIGLARIEISIIDLEKGTIILADRTTARAPDLAEHLAAKTALQKGGRILAVKMLPELIKQFPEFKKGNKK